MLSLNMRQVVLFKVFQRTFLCAYLRFFTHLFRAKVRRYERKRNVHYHVLIPRVRPQRVFYNFRVLELHIVNFL